GVSGGIAAYKTCEIVSSLKKLGADVWVVMTKEAAQLVGPLTFRTLSGNPVILDLFSQDTINSPVPHIALAEKADLILIAPSTANIIGKIAHGIADDALTTIVMASLAKKMMAPAMNCNMWRCEAVRKNSRELRVRGWEMIGPVEGHLACGVEDIGRMAEPTEIVKKVIELLGIKQDLAGKKILVTAGGTREAIDPVRYISNRSSGKMGYALAEAARERGAEVALISANVDLPSPLDIQPIRIESAEDMLTAVEKNIEKADIVVMAAAVSDFRPKEKKQGKIKKAESRQRTAEHRIILEETEDILSYIAKRKDRKDKIVVGFALETENLIQNAKNKIKDKKLDIIIANGPENFGTSNGNATIISKNGKSEKLKSRPKKEIAGKILDAILRL
ncbi:MAG: bifunctional phosphopantothenoylcysteine decarboxylase/phosphopantothenate--cysteine ligase CoaBC, partial [Candidatus Margulisiibacteriota bacterium]